jgi:hypothetical protein
LVVQLVASRYTNCTILAPSSDTKYNEINNKDEKKIFGKSASSTFVNNTEAFRLGYRLNGKGIGVQFLAE